MVFCCNFKSVVYCWYPHEQWREVTGIPNTMLILMALY